MIDGDRGPMEQAVRKWDGDVYHGHEPEAWADLRMIAIAQDADLAEARKLLASRDAEIVRLREAIPSEITVCCPSCAVFFSVMPDHCLRHDEKRDINGECHACADEENDAALAEHAQRAGGSA